MQGKGGEIMERLTMFSAIGGYQEYDPIDIVENDYSIANFKKLVEKLGEYEDLEEQGLLLRLPCKVGTKNLYLVDEDKEIYRLNSDEVTIKRFPSGKIIFEYDSSEFYYDDFGKIVFLTREEAEAKLKELEGARIND